MTQAPTTDRLEAFNAMPESSAVAELLLACHSQRWADAVARQRPYAGLDVLQEVADRVWTELGPADWREALAGHPRIGESGGSSADLSRREQSGMAGADDDVRAAIAAGNAEYEARFGHVFLISAAGRSPQEILDNLRSRLDNDADEELRIAAEEHRRITRQRLADLVG